MLCRIMGVNNLFRKLKQGAYLISKASKRTKGEYIVRLVNISTLICYEDSNLL